MSISRDPTAAGIANWDALSDTQQLLTVESVAREYALRNKSALQALGSRVVSVGAGFRERTVGSRYKKQRRVYRDEVVLVVFVDEKGDADVPVPDRVHLSAIVQGAGPGEGKRRVLSIPTDVVERSQDAQAEFDMLLRADHPSRNFINGTACALVRTHSDSTPYLLGCHHVLRMSLDDPHARSVPGCHVETNALQRIGTPVGGDLMPGAPNIDAALTDTTEVPGGQVVRGRSFWRHPYPSGIAHTHAEWADLVVRQRPNWILTPWGTNPKVALKYVRVEYNKLINYSFQTVRVAEVHVYQCTPTGTKTYAGYSGAPIVGGGVLVGMHIAGEVIRVGNQHIGYSYATPSYAICDPGPLTTPGLTLAQPN